MSNTEYISNPNRETNREFIIGLYQDYGLEKSANKEVYAHYEEAISNGLIPDDKPRSSWEGECRRIRLQLLRQEIYLPEEDETDVIKHNLSLEKKQQRLMDLNRVHRKEKREDFRKVNALEEMNKELIKLLEGNSLKDFTKKHKVNDNQKDFVIIAHGTDYHLNELVKETQSLHNDFDFNIASQRIKKYAEEVKRQVKAYNAKQIVLAFTGDILNNDKLYDKLLSQSTNRTKATLLAVYLLEQLILDLNTVANVTIATVTGNESRVNDGYNSIEYLVSDSFDVMIDQILRIIFKKANGIKFVDGSYMEKVINIGNVHILMIHGDRLKQKTLDREVYSKMAKYAQKGCTIDYCILGHIHQASISEFYGRGASLVGGNSYSSETLNLLSKASQNIYIVNSKTKDIHGIKVDLQNVEGVVGYDIKKELEAYNAKSADKMQDHTTVFKIII